jgi:hypothetical protein
MGMEITTTMKRTTITAMGNTHTRLRMAIMITITNIIMTTVIHMGKNMHTNTPILTGGTFQKFVG